MYLDFYNLGKRPFQTTPDPEFLFLSPSHKEALAAIMYGVEQRKGFVAITGEVGVGKTTIIRSYLEGGGLEGGGGEKLKTLYIFNPGQSFAGLLKAIFGELGMEAGTDDPQEMLNRLYGILIEEYKKGHNVALVIDEAQNMPMQTLESLRMLSNLETSKDKLIQIILAGQPELAQMLERKELRQLRQRIALKAVISPLSRDECAAYIQHRMARASSRGTAVFTQRALKKIIAQSGGIPRVINVLCDNALITGFGYQKMRVDYGVAKEVIAGLRGASARAYRKKLLFPAVAILVFLGAVAVSPHIVGILSGRVLPGTQTRPAYKAAAGGLHAAPLIAAREASAAVPDTSYGEGVPIKRTVKEGDTLLGLVRDIYGNDDEKLVRLVMRSNTSITNRDIIRTGEKIIFPADVPSREEK